MKTDITSSTEHQRKIKPISESLDLLYDKAKTIVILNKMASPALLQRKLNISYERSTQFIKKMELEGLVGPADGARPREVLSSVRQNEEHDNILSKDEAVPPLKYNYYVMKNTLVIVLKIIRAIIVGVFVGSIILFLITAAGHFIEEVMKNGDYTYFILVAIVGYSAMEAWYRLDRKLDGKPKSDKSWVMGYWNDDDKA